LAEYLLDTDHLSYLQEGHSAVVARYLALSPNDRVMTSAVNVGEVLRGANEAPEGRKRQRLLEGYRHLLQQMREIIPVTMSEAEQYAEIGAGLSRKGTPIPVHDVWIAATALARGAVLVTNDQHFALVEGLKTENWSR
jgi:predicted nucleic acid-binding protein